MISVKQVYPLPDVEEFTISPEHGKPRRPPDPEAVESTENITPARVHRFVADGTVFRLLAANIGTDTNAGLENG